MSEKLATVAPERLKHGSHESLPHVRPERGERPRRSSAERASSARETIKHEAETQTNPLERLRATEAAANPAPATFINRELKAITLRRELGQIRRRLSPVERGFSRVIHQPAVRILSETTGKTLSRPSGLLGGGVAALIGTSIYLYLAKHVGFAYNYGVFLLLFVGGFGLGLLLELTVSLAVTRRRK